jgi:hypothetical protein
MVSAINVVSENQAQLSHAVKAIQNKDRIRDCKTNEEEEGRMNCDMLNRFIVIGGPYFDPGPNLQGQLQEQVPQTTVIYILVVSYLYYSPFSNLTSQAPLI